VEFKRLNVRELLQKQGRSLILLVMEQMVSAGKLSGIELAKYETTGQISTEVLDAVVAEVATNRKIQIDIPVTKKFGTSLSRPPRRW